MQSQGNLCISYARVSSGRQSREGFGLERQLERAQQYAAQHSLKLDDRLSLQDAGKSGSKGEHIAKGAALYQVLEAAKQGGLGASPTLLIEDISRLSRLEMMDGLEKIFLPMFRAGVQIVLLEDGSRYDANAINRDQTAMLTLVLKIQAAANYACKLREYGLQHRAKNRKQILDRQPVCAGWAPSWIELHEGEWRLSAKAPAIQRLIELLWEVGTTTAAATLNREGHRAPQGGTWTQGAVRRILENPAVYGARRFAKPDHIGRVKEWKEQRAKWEAEGSEGDPPKKPKRQYEVTEHVFPALMSQADYDRLIATIKKRATSSNERGRRDQVRFIGQMVTHCVCGGRIGNQIARRGNLTYGYLTCRGRSLGQTDCRRTAFNLNAVQANLLTRLKTADLEALTQQATLKTKSEHDALLAQELRLQSNKLAVDRQLTNARTALKNAIKSGKATTDVFEEAVAEAQAAATDTQKALASVMADLQALQRDGLPERLENAVQVLLMSFAKDIDTAEQRRAVSQLIQDLDLRITLDSAEQKVGIAVGDGEPIWEQVNPSLDRAALLQGMSGSVSRDLELDDETILRLRELSRQQGSDIVDMGDAVAEILDLKRGSGPFLIDVSTLRRVKV